MRETKGGYYISQIKQTGGRVFERLLGEAGIEEFNGAQGKILYVLWQADQMPIVELSRRTSLAKSTLTSMLDRMEKRGLLERIPSDKDRRQINIRLTDCARVLQADYECVSEQMNECYYKGFADEEIAQFESMLARVLDNLREVENQRR